MQIDAVPGPLASYPWIRWGRKMPRAAAVAFMEMQVGMGIVYDAVCMFAFVLQ